MTVEGAVADVVGAVCTCNQLEQVSGLVAGPATGVPEGFVRSCGTEGITGRVDRLIP
jgi:hypothetical protein